MEAYLNIIRKIINEGTKKENRTGIDTYSIAGVMFEHDMSKGFPLLTTKKVPFRLITNENYFFINGITDKNFLRDQNIHIWDDWCNPQKVKYGHDESTKQKMKEERDLGAIYGFQWRHFNGDYISYDKEPKTKGVDQLENLVNTLKTNPNDRRMIVSAWNPNQLDKMALPPCHYGFQVIVNGDKLNLMWNQRSVDSALGLPFNIAGYGLILHLLAKESGFKEGRLVGFLGDTHIYENHLEGLEEQLSRKPKDLPIIKTDNFKSIFDWKPEDSKIENYNPDKNIKFEIAV